MVKRKSIHKKPELNEIYVKNKVDNSVNIKRSFNLFNKG